MIWISRRMFKSSLEKVQIPRYLVLNRVTSKSKIGGAFPVKCKMELVSGYISGGFPVMQSKIFPFRIFRVNRRNLSVYLSLF